MLEVEDPAAAVAAGARSMCVCARVRGVKHGADAPALLLLAAGFCNQGRNNRPRRVLALSPRCPMA